MAYDLSTDYGRRAFARSHDPAFRSFLSATGEALPEFIADAAELIDARVHELAGIEDTPAARVVFAKVEAFDFILEALTGNDTAVEILDRVRESVAGYHEALGIHHPAAVAVVPAPEAAADPMDF